MHQAEWTTSGARVARIGRALAAVAVASAVVAGVAACGIGGERRSNAPDDGAPATASGEPTPSPSPAATATPGITDPEPFYPADGPPPRPAAMDTPDVFGAAAAARYFVEVLNAAGNSGDTTLLEDLSDPECSFCAKRISAAAASAAEQAATGRLWESGPITFTWVKAFEEEPEGRWTVDVDFDCAPGRYVDATGAVIETETRALTYHADIEVTYDGHDWLIREMTTEAVTWSDE